MLRTVKHGVLVLMGFSALLLTWPFAIVWMRHGGNIMDARQFFGDAIRAGGTSAFLSIDLLFTWIAFIVWVIGDARGLGMKNWWGWGFAALSFVAVSLAFPLYIVVRERFIERREHTESRIGSNEIG